MSLQEIVRFRNVSADLHGVCAVKDATLTIFKGEALGIVGGCGSGKTALLRLISGDIKPVTGTVEYTWQDSRGKRLIYFINDRQTLVQDLTVAENLFLYKTPCGFRLYHKRHVFAESQNILDEFGINIKASQTVRSLTKLGALLIEMVKAYVQHAEIILLDDVLMDCNGADITEFFRIQKQLQEKGITFVITDYGVQALRHVSDRLLFIGNGHCLKWEFREESTKRFLIPELPSDLQEKISEKEDGTAPNASEKILEACSIDSDFISGLSFCVHRGETLGLYGMNKAQRTELVYMLLGRKKDYRGKLLFRGGNYLPKSVHYLKKNGVAFLQIRMMVDRYLFPNLTILENICIGLYGKASKLRIRKKNLQTTVLRNYAARFDAESDISKTECRAMDILAKRMTSLCRLEAQNPLLLICEEPYAIADCNEDALMDEFLFNMKRNGVAILILSANDRKLRQVCDTVQRFVNL